MASYPISGRQIRMTPNFSMEVMVFSRDQYITNAYSIPIAFERRSVAVYFFSIF
jgi:hypothetical protein